MRHHGAAAGDVRPDARAAWHGRLLLRSGRLRLNHRAPLRRELDLQFIEAAQVEVGHVAMPIVSFEAQECYELQHSSSSVRSDGPFARGLRAGKGTPVPRLCGYVASRFTSSSAASRPVMPARTPQARASSLAALMTPSW